MKTRLLNILIVALALAATSCSGVKNLTKPQLDLPQELAGNSTDSATVADMDWWKFYTDSALVYIISETLDHNRDLMAAGARVEQMRELYGLSKANFFPTLGAHVMGNQETNDYYN